MSRSFVALCAFVFAVLSVPAYAQQVNGNILGSVLDPQGAAIAGAKVSAVNTATNFSRSVQTTAQGEYRLEFLPPGNYTVEVTSAGFRTFQQTGVILEVGQFAR